MILCRFLTAFIEKILERFRITSGRSVPADPNVKLRPRRAEEPGGTWPFREAVGCLMWVCNMTRPDISNAVRDVARHAHDPSPQHWEAVRYILRYLRDTKTLGLTFQRGRGLRLTVYSDSDYARNDSDRKSVSGGVIICGGRRCRGIQERNVV